MFNVPCWLFVTVVCDICKQTIVAKNKTKNGAKLKAAFNLGHFILDLFKESSNLSNQSVSKMTLFLKSVVFSYNQLTSNKSGTARRKPIAKLEKKFREEIVIFTSSYVIISKIRKNYLYGREYLQQNYFLPFHLQAPE